MTKPPPKLDPATEAVVRRMLATPPQPKGVVKAKAHRLAIDNSAGSRDMSGNGPVKSTFHG